MHNHYLNSLKRILFSIVLAILSFIPWLHQSNSVILQWISIPVVLFLPGLLILTISKLYVVSIWELIVYSVGLSISYLMGIGLIINWVMPLLGQQNPLTSFNVLLFFTITNIVLVLIIFWKKQSLNHLLSYSTFKWRHTILFVVPPVILIVSIFGIFLLNNGGSNNLIIITFCMMAVYVPVLVLVYKKIPEYFLPFSLLFISISLLLMSSLRSNHIVGWDIANEYRLFQRTFNANLWTIRKYDPYEACLSITILPTILSHLTGLRGEYIYKLIFQIVFSLVPIIIFILFRSFVSRIISFLAVFYFVIQPFFTQPTTGLIRQETAFLFFSLVLLSLFSNTISAKYRTILSTIFGLSMVVSHYSTSYFAILLFTVTYLMMRVLLYIGVQPFIEKILDKISLYTNTIALYKTRVKGTYILILFFGTFFWYSQLTHTSSNIVGIAKDSLRSINKLFVVQSKSEEVSKALSIDANNSQNDQLQLLLFLQRKNTQFNKPYPLKYGKELYKDYQIKPAFNKSVPPLIRTPFNTHIITGFNLLKLISKIALILGAIYLLFLHIKKKKFSTEYVLISLTGTSFIMLLLIHPTLGAYYNLPRIYLQTLLFLSPMAIYGLILLFKPIAEKARLFVVCFFLSVLFLYFSGVVTEVIGGEALIQLHNYGDDYDKFHIPDAEKKGVEWYKNNINRKTPLFTDVVTNLRFVAYTDDIDSIQVVLPSVLYKNSYVAARTANIQRLRGDINFEGKYFQYNFPLEFLQKEKNLIYNNGSFQIYK